MHSYRGICARFAQLVALALFVPATTQALEVGNGLMEIHGFAQMQLRGMSDGYRFSSAHLSQWANIVNIEAEIDLAPDGFGPFDMVQGFLRYEARFDCVWVSACGLSPTLRFYGDHATRAPDAWANGRSSGRVGYKLHGTSDRVHGRGSRLVDILQLPSLQESLVENGSSNLDATFKRIREYDFAVQHVHGSLGPSTLPLGPIRPRDEIDATGILMGKGSEGIALPFRPDTDDLYTPSKAFLGYQERFDSFDQNFTQSELAWNRGASQQQTKELKEAYIDLELLEGALFLRVGKQTIVWGKTELFRNTDQFNPQDLALATLPGLEESRVALWSARAIYSVYTMGPFEDFRLELAMNLDHFEPNDLGRCGEPYAVALVCLKSSALFLHGLFGFGAAGEDKPAKPWESIRGLEFGARAEFRWGDFSFAITDFYGYEDFPTLDYFNGYQRYVDPNTGRPLKYGSSGSCTTGSEASCLTAASAAALTSANRQLFDVICTSTLAPDIGDSNNLYVTGGSENNCIFDLFNDFGDTTIFFTIPQANSLALGGFVGATTWNVLKGLLAEGVAYPDGIALNRSGAIDRNGIGGNGLSAVLTNEQEALIGCGPFYFDENEHLALDNGDALGVTGSCSQRGIDFFNAEASVLIQEFPGFRRGTPVATRWVNGQLVMLPGSRGPFNFFDQPAGFRYDPDVDGCVGDLDVLKQMGLITVKERNSIPNKTRCDGATLLVDPDTGDVFSSEMAALSQNLLHFLIGSSKLADGLISDGTTDCDETNPVTCDLVVSLIRATGVQRPDRVAGGNGVDGRRDFLWQGGSEIGLFYNKRNVLGFATDFTEKWTKTSWGVELSWVKGQSFENNNRLRGYSFEDTYNLSLSIDRPTFIHFINPTSTIFFNMQWFVRYIPSYRGGGEFNVDGPLSALGTLTAFTGFHQDRLLVFATFVYDVTSQSGGEIVNFTYRFNDAFSATVGMSSFFGEPSRALIPLRPPVLQNEGNDYTQRTSFQGLTPVAGRDEINLQLRYTF